MHAGFQVNVFVQKCDPGTCNCGVAVKSGTEVFILDQCRIRNRNSESLPMRLGLLECSEKSMDIVESTPNTYSVNYKHYLIIAVVY